MEPIIKPKGYLLLGFITAALLGTSQYALAGSQPYTSAGSITPPDGFFTSPRGVVVDPNGKIWVAASRFGTGAPANSSFVYQFDSLNGYSNQSFSGTTGGGSHISFPHGIAVSGNTVYLGELTNAGTGAGRIRAFNYTAGAPGTLTQIAIDTEVFPNSVQQIALGSNDGLSCAYMGSNTAGFVTAFGVLPNVWFMLLVGEGLRGPTGVAIDAREILYLTDGDGSPVQRYSQSNNAQLSPMPNPVSNPYGLAIAPSGHILVSQANSDNNSIAVFKANGLPAFTIPVSLTDGATLTHLAVDPLTGRVYVSADHPDNHVYMFDVPSFRPPTTILGSLTVPSPTAISNAVTTTAQADPNYQSAFGDTALNTSSLQTAANNYANPNTSPYRQASVNTNISTFNLIQNHVDLLKLSESDITSGPQSAFQMAHHQHFSEFKQGGLESYKQKQWNRQNTQPLSAQPSKGTWLGTAPTVSFMNDLKNFSVWMQNTFSQTDNGITPTVDANRGRLHAWTFGADAKFWKQSRAGVFGGQSKSNVHLMNTPNTQDETHKKYVGVYGVHFFESKREHVTPSLDGNMMVGKGHSDHARDLSLVGYPQIATSRQAFWDLSTRLRFTLSQQCGEHLSIAPYVYAGWMYFKEKQVNEQGAGAFNQSRPAQIFQVAEGSVGTQITAPFERSFGLVMPGLKLGIAQTTTINQQKILPIALAGGGTFDSAQVPLKQFAYDLGASLAFQWNNGLSLMASYLGEYGKNHYKRNEVLIEAKLYF